MQDIFFIRDRFSHILDIIKITKGENKMELLHLTTAEDLDSILEQGLIPRKGKNSSAAEEEDEYIFLCQDRDVPYWQILLNKSYLIRVDVSGLQAIRRPYSRYGEFLISDPIPPSRIKLQGKLSKPRNSIMETLCMDYLDVLTVSCQEAALYYSDRNCVSHEVFESTLWSFNYIKQNLNYNVVPAERLEQKIRSSKARLNCAFTDIYEGTRLWEKLPMYPKDDLSQVREDMYEYIRDNLDRCNHIDTGSWSPETTQEPQKAV